MCIAGYSFFTTGWPLCSTRLRVHCWLKRIKIWHIPPRSPDLNPVEQVWAHLKRKLKAMDLADAVAQRPLLGKTAYKLRVRRLVRSRSFQRIAANVAMGLKKTCKEVIRKRGAAAGR